MLVTTYQVSYKHITGITGGCLLIKESIKTALMWETHPVTNITANYIS